MKNRTSPFISVVIPMYNVAPYIERSIQSVLAQTFTNFEIICVDDGCQDNTVALVEQFADERIKIVAQRNRGLAAARNCGIHASNGAFVAFLDADDLWHCEKLERHFQHLSENPELGVSYSASHFIDEHDKKLGLAQTPKINDITADHILCRNPIGNGSAPVIRKLALHDIAFDADMGDETRRMFFNEKLRQSEDIELWVRMALNTRWKFAGIAEELTYYRLNAGGLSANLEKQLRSWEVAMELNYAGHETFFDRYLPLARAYQKRYLARRAVQSNNGIKAIALLSEALFIDHRIVKQEPVKTGLTAACAFLALLPKGLYDSLQTLGIKLFQKQSTQSVAQPLAQ